MSQFELITTVLSLILGLSMSHMLWVVASMVRARNEFRLHWLPFIWAMSIFLHHAGFFLGGLMIDQEITAWSWGWYSHMLLLAVLLFGSGALILPSESQQRVGDLLQDFREHGRLALIPFAGYHLVWMVANVRLSGWGFNQGQLANVILLGLLLMGFKAKRMAIQGTAAILFLAVLIWAHLFVWAQTAL